MFFDVTRGLRRPSVCWVLGLVLLSTLAVAQESAALARPPVRSGCEIDYPPFCMVTDDGRAEGFSVELFRAALKAMGREATFRTGTWPDIRRDLEQGRIDTLPLVGRTPEREKLFDFTFPYLTLHGAIVVRQDNRDISGPQDLRGREVAVLKDDNAEEYLRRGDLGSTLVTVDSFDRALRELSEGRHDAVVIQRLLAVRLIRQANLQNLKIVDKPLVNFKQEFCFAVRKGDRELLSTLNEGLALVMADGTFRRLHARWFAAMELPTRGRIVVGGDHDLPPYEYLDEDGQPAGYDVELTRAVAAYLNLDVEIRLGPWASIRSQLAAGDIDLVQGMFYSAQRAGQFEFSQAHTVVHHVGVVRAGDGKPPENVEQLKGKRLVVQDGDIMHDYALEHGLGDPLTAVATQQEALRQLRDGQHDCALVARVPALYWIDRNGWTDLAVGEVPLLSPDYCYAAPHDRRQLMARVSDALSALRQSGRYREIHDKWLGVYTEPRPTFVNVLRRTLWVLLPLVALLAGALLWSRTLRRQVRARTAALEEEVDVRRRMEIALKQQHDRLDRLTETSPVAITMVGRDGTITFANRRAEDLLGLARDQMAGMTYDAPDWHITDFEGNPFPDEKLPVHRVLKTGKPVYDIQHAIVSSDGSRKLLSINAAPLLNEDGSVQGVVVCLQDITEQRSIEEKLRQSEKMQAIGQLAGGIAHDFNNQLAAVLGYADLLVGRLKDPKLAGYAETIKRAATRAADLTRQLLAFSRKGKHLSVPVELNKVLAEVVSIVEHTVDRRIAVRLALNASPSTTTGDPTQLQNVFLNLALNARDAMPEGGELVISTESVDLDEGFCRTHPYEIAAGPYIRVNVTDTGCGMPPEVLRHIFEPFYTTKKEGQGTGMGLASVYGAVRSHRGAVTVYSETGHGTTFKVYLPLAPEAADASPTRRKPVRGTARVLIVDDEEAVRTMGAEILRDLGYKVAVCADGGEALDYYRASWRSVDLVILDMVMPGMNGRDTFVRMRNINPDIRAILSSGYSINGAAQAILDEGVVDFVGKPFSISELSQVVARVLGGESPSPDGD